MGHMKKCTLSIMRSIQKKTSPDKKLLQDEGYEIYPRGGLMLIEIVNTYGTINSD